MSNHSGVEHRANYHFLKIEEDYIALCQALKGKQSAHCKALLLAVLEHWINDKRAKEEEGYVYMTYAQWEESIYGIFGRTSIIACLSELLKERLISKRKHTLSDGKVTFAYALNIPLLQKKLRALPERPDRPPRPKLNASKTECVQNETRPKTDASGVQKRTEDASKNGRFLDSDSSIDSSHIDSDEPENEQESDDQEAPTGAVSQSSSFSFENGEEEDTPPPSEVSDQVEMQKLAWFEHLATAPLSPELVLELADYYLPPLPMTVSKEKREEHAQNWHIAAEKLACARELVALSPEQAKQRLVSLLRFISDPTSPCWYVREFPKRYPGSQVRLWHLANRSFKVGVDLDKSGWQPDLDDLERALRARCQCGECWDCRWRTMRETQARSTDRDPEPTATPETDMDEASKIIEAVLSSPDQAALPETDDLPTTEPVTALSLIDGVMSYELCLALLGQIRQERPGYFATHRPVPGGYVIEVLHSPGEQAAVLSSPGDWYSLLDMLARRPRPLTLAERRARLRRQQQEEAS